MNQQFLRSVLNPTLRKAKADGQYSSYALLLGKKAVVYAAEATAALPYNGKASGLAAARSIALQCKGS